MENMTLPIQLINQILAYLGSRPYQEVYQIIDALQKEAAKELKNGDQVDQ